MSDKKEWTLSRNRFVCFLDIMGFKDKIVRKKPIDIYKKLKELSETRHQIDSVKESDFNVKIKTVNFSDSIIIFTEKDTLNDLRIISLATNFLVNHSMDIDFAIKGAIAHGNMTLNFNNNIFFGQPLVDAFELQEDLKFYGIVAHHSIEPFLNYKTISNRIKENYFKCEVPMKYGKVNHYILDWFCVDDYKCEIKGNVTINRIETLMHRHGKNVSGEPRKYIDNTLTVLKQIMSQKEL